MNYFFLNFFSLLRKNCVSEKVWLGRKYFGLWGVKNSKNISSLYFMFQGILVISKRDLYFWVIYIYIYFSGDCRGE